MAEPRDADKARRPGVAAVDPAGGGSYLTVDRIQVDRPGASACCGSASRLAPPRKAFMFASVARALFGSANDRSLKAHQRRVPAINALEPSIQILDDDALAAKTVEFRSRLAAGATPGRPAARGVRGGARGVPPGARHAPLRRAAHRRDGAAFRPHRRDAHRRGQDLGGDARGLSQRAGPARRACGDGQRLPGPPRRRGDGPALRLPGPVDRRDRAKPHRRRTPRGLSCRRHLRHQQRVRLRLPARQHEVPPGGHGPARLRLCDRGRGGLHPDRRGAHDR